MARLETAGSQWSPPKVALGRRHRLVGREQELEKLRGHLDRALDGEGSFVIVGGEPGVGKTRLAEEILHEALDRGAMVLLGHCTEMDLASPYTPIVEQLDYARPGSSRGRRSGTSWEIRLWRSPGSSRG